MKQKTRLATKTEMVRNLTEARKRLGELRFYNFTPAEGLNIKKGLVSINWFARGTMLPGYVLIKSRGSFLEVQFDDMLFAPLLLEKLRQTLWVPIHVGKTIPVVETNLKDLIHKNEHEEFDFHYPNARR